MWDADESPNSDTVGHVLHLLTPPPLRGFGFPGPLAQGVVPRKGHCLGLQMKGLKPRGAGTRFSLANKALISRV